MSFFRPIGPLIRGWIFSFLGWGVLAFALGVQVGRVSSFSWTTIALFGVRDWFILALITPLLFRLVGRFPIERERWLVTIPVYLASCVAVVMLCRWWADDVITMQMIFQRAAREARSQEAASPDDRDRTRGSEPGLRPPGVREGGPEDRDRIRLRGPRSPGRPDSGPKFRGFWLFGPGGIQLTLYLVLISVAHALHFYRKSQDRERRSLELTASLAQARLSALRMQLQPHFLFNSLNAIAALVHKDPDAADEMIGALSDFLRLTLESSGEQEVPLRRELEFVERYLAIEKVRFGDRLSYRIDAPPETLDVRVPALLLQPIVENSIRHGLASQVAAGEIEITARKQNGTLALKIRDNGVGLASSEPKEGVGLANTRARLQESYGEKASLNIADQNGAVVNIRLPSTKVG